MNEMGRPTMNFRSTFIVLREVILVQRLPHDSFLRHFLQWRNQAVTALLILICWRLGDFWILRYPGVVLMQAVDEKKPPKLAKHTALVTIGPAEYKEIFEEQSPLNAAKLRTAIEQILLLDPELLAIDIDTAHESFKVLRDQYLNAKVIWARGVVPVAGESGGELRFKAGGFLGEDSANSSYAGIAGFERDPDWTIRRLQGCVNLGADRMQTFHRTIYRRVVRGTRFPDCAEPDLPVRRYEFVSVSLNEVAAAAKAATKTSQPKQPSVLAGKIVVLGGKYSPADYHAGPAGLAVPGVELVASAVEVQMDSPGRDSIGWLHHAFPFLADWLLAALVAWVYFQKWPPFAKLFTTLLLAGVTLFVPGVLLYWYGFWSHNPFVLVFGMLISQMYEAAAGASHDERAPQAMAAGAA